MAISQAFDPFECTVSKGGVNWVVIVIILLALGGLCYFAFKDQIELVSEKY